MPPPAPAPQSPRICSEHRASSPLPVRRACWRQRGGRRGCETIPGMWSGARPLPCTGPGGVARWWLTCMTNLASTYRNQGRWKEAEELQMQVLKTDKNMLGVEHPDTLTRIANLASIYWNQGRWNEAEELQMQVLRCRSRLKTTYTTPVLPSLSTTDAVTVPSLFKLVGVVILLKSISVFEMVVVLVVLVFLFTMSTTVSAV